MLLYREWKMYAAVSLVFLGAAAALILLRWAWAIPVLPFLLFVVYLSIFSLDGLFWMTVALVPLSVPLRFLLPGLGWDMSLPAEPLLILIALLVVLKGIRENLFPATFIRHPLTLALFAYLAWMLVTVLTSTMPLVSLKYFLAHLWFIVPVYFLGFLLFRSPGAVNRFLILYVAAFSVIIVYTFYHQVGTGLFNQKAAHSAMHPFYNDHTAYGAMLALFIPVLCGWIFQSGEFRPAGKGISLLLFILFSMALVFSYSRAAWLSVAGMAVIWVLIRFRVRFSLILSGVLVAIVLFFVFQSTIWIRLQENRQESSASISKHLESVTNVRSDASNLERLLRWQCALDMFAEKPLTGWGPGTYMFQYAPFQKSYQRTIISTNFGDRGNAHSEYLGPLAESGWPGVLTILLLVFFSVYTGIRTSLRTENKGNRILALSLTLGLITYFIHGLMNNFLDTDKAAVPVWGFMSILVALDLQTRDAGTH